MIQFIWKVTCDKSVIVILKVIKYFVKFIKETITMKYWKIGVLILFLILSLPLLVWAEYIEESFLRFKAEGPVNLVPYLDFSRLYVKAKDKSLLENFLKEVRLKNEHIIDTEGTEVLAKVRWPIKDLKTYLLLLNTLNRDGRIIFASPVFAFYESKTLIFKSLLSIKNTISIQLKPGVNPDDFKKIAAKIGIDSNSITVSENGLFILTVSKSSPYDPFRVAAFFSPYFDPRFIESSFMWVRLETPAQATIKAYPLESRMSNAGFLLLQSVVLELKVKTLIDVEFQPQNIGPQTSILRGWQPEGVSSAVFDFLDIEPEVIKEVFNRYIIWHVKYRGRFLKYGDFSFPAISIPIHLLTENGKAVLSAVETNSLKVHIGELSGSQMIDLVPLGLDKLPLETYWRKKLIKLGFLSFGLFFTIAIILAWPWVISLLKKETKQELTLASRLEMVLKPFQELNERFAKNSELILNLAFREQWFEYANKLLSDFAVLINKEKINFPKKSLELIHKELEVAQFSQEWNVKWCAELLAKMKNISLEISRQEKQ